MTGKMASLPVLSNHHLSGNQCFITLASLLIGIHCIMKSLVYVHCNYDALPLARNCVVNNSLMHVALADTRVSYFSENYDHHFTQDLDWNWSEVFLRVVYFQSLPIVNGVTDVANVNALTSACASLAQFQQGT